jgi:hypothetical protein
MPEWQGVYFYGDYCSGTIWGLPGASMDMVPASASAAQPVLLFQTSFQITTFGIDDTGELYVADRSGGVYRLEKR